MLAACGSQVIRARYGQTERWVMTERGEIAGGQKAHQQPLLEYGIYANPAFQAYVNDMGQRLAK